MHADEAPPDGRAGIRRPPESAPLPRALTILLGLAAAVVVILGARELAWLIGPVFLALVIVLLVHPLHTWLRHKKVPEGVALVALLLAIFGVLVVLGSILVLAVGRLVTVLPQYAAEADGLVSSLRELLIAQGISRDTAVEPAVRRESRCRRSRRSPRCCTGVAGLVVNAIFLLSLMLFLGIDATGALGRMAAVEPAAGRGWVRRSGSSPPTPAASSGVTTVFAVITGRRRHPAAAVAGHPAGRPVGTAGRDLQLHPVRGLRHRARAAAPCWRC